MSLFVNDVATIKTAGQINGVERTMSGSWDLSTGNNWLNTGTNVPQPTNGVAGQNGIILVTAEPSSWPANGALKYPGGTAPVLASYPSVIPFYVKSATEVLTGSPIEDIT